MTRVAVVGGGLSGVTVAYRLRQLLDDDAKITVFESTGRLGGKLRTVELAGVGFDVGAEAFLARRPEATALVREIGLGDRLTHPTKARAKIQAGGSVLGLPAGTFMGIPASAAAVAGVLSEAGTRAVAAESTLPPVSLPAGDLPLGPLLRERFGNELVDRLVDPLLGGVYAGGADGLGLRATMPGLVSALASGTGSLTAAAASLLATSSSAAPVFGTLRGGLGTFIGRLAELARAEDRLGVAVRSLTPHPTGDGWRLELSVASPAPAAGIVDVDAVVLAVPAPAARCLLDRIAPDASKAFGEVELASVAVVGLALPPGTELPVVSGVLIGAGERRPGGRPFAAKAFTFSARKWAHYGDGPVLVRGSIGRCGEQDALHLGDGELVRAVLADFAALTGVTAKPIESLVTRWRDGLPQYGAGHLDRIARIEQVVAELPGFEITGAALHGVGIPACIATAEAAATRIAAWLTR